MVKEDYTSVVYKVHMTYEKAAELTKILNDTAIQTKKRAREISWLVGQEYPPYLVSLKLEESNKDACRASLEITSPNKGMAKKRVTETLPKELTDIIGKFNLKWDK